MTRRQLIVLAVLLLAAIALPFAVSNYRTFQFTLVLVYAIALLGGIDSPMGAVTGGFTVGVLENLLGAFVIGNELKLTVALVLIVGVLLVRHSGFFGSVHVSRV